MASTSQKTSGRRDIKKSMFFLLFLLLLSPSMAVAAGEDYPVWLRQWREWAASTKDQNFIEWADTLSAPEAVELGRQWESFLGYTAPQLAEKDTRAPSIKPGLVITPENIAKYEKELRQLFPYGFDWEVDRLTGTGVFAGYNYFPLEMVIVPTTHAWNDRGFLEATKKYADNCSIDAQGNLTGWVAGIPFPHPQNAQQVVHNYDRLTVMADNLNSMPMSIGLYGRNGTRERVEKIELHWNNYAGRIKLNPIPSIPGFEDIYEKGSILALYPYDLKGYAAVRTRYKDSGAEDSFISYVPSMRRIRRLAGSNTQDPLVGSDLTWEDWKGYWSKISTHPADFELLGEAVVLCPSFNPKPIKYSDKYGGVCQRYWWERRPVWIVKITYRDSSYIYGSRIWYVDRETFALQQQMLYDRQGRLWKLWDWCWRWNPRNGELNYWNPWMADVVNKHTSVIDHHIILNMPNLSEDIFTLRYLIEKGH